MAAITHYDQGDAWVPQATFKVGGTNTDPTNITVKYKNPDGTVTTLGPVSGATGGSGITRVSAGVYTITVDLIDAGYWFARFEGTGAAAGTEEHQAIVDPSEFYESAQLSSRALVGLAETKDWLQIQNVQTTNDLEIANVINDMSHRFHEECQREIKVIGTNPQVRSFDADTLAILRRTVNVGDLTSFTQVRILDRDGNVLETVAAGDIISLPREVTPRTTPIRQLQFTPDVMSLVSGYVIEVTGTWGFPSVPGNVKQAVKEAVSAALDRDVEHYSQDLAPTPAATGGNVIVIGGGRQRLLSMSPSSLAVAWSLRDTLVA